MNARTGAEIGDTSAQELLARLLTPDEYIAVLRFAQDRKLETDSEVFFLVSLLKFFAFQHDRMLHTVRVAEEGRKDIEATTILGEQNIREAIADFLSTVEKVIAENTRTMAFHANRFAALTGEIKALEKDLRATIRDADGAFNLYSELKDNGSKSTLSRLFYDRAKEALDRQVPFFEDSIRMLISRENRKVMIVVGVSFVVQTLLLLVSR